MPEPVLEYDEAGHVSGAHFAEHDESHRIIEDFMLAANEAVAEPLRPPGGPVPAPRPPGPGRRKARGVRPVRPHARLQAAAAADRFDLQRVLDESAKTSERHAVHYAMLRSLKQATYSPEQDEHFALASDHYCHFTSPIRRYPDLTVHRQLGQWLAHGRVRTDFKELRSIADHCSKTERRAESAEREAGQAAALELPAATGSGSSWTR